MHMQEAKPAGGLHELSLLATLIKPHTSKASNFKLNLFGDSTQPAPASVGESSLTFARMFPLWCQFGVPSMVSLSLPRVIFVFTLVLPSAT